MNTSPKQFFKDYAGFSYRPGVETKAQGREKYARKLAAAERKARDAGFSFHWEIDQDIDSSEFIDESPAWNTWNCTMRDCQGKVRGSLCGVDFGADGSPWGSTYRRVVEAELACEVF